eukprot:TRINITY_DN5329_c0_g2_i1.p1 TRINITY_DN5329_c0_g2~~TRINITY_DN5329_c0_g2_i1.p1  ORF type:complete len:173 (+),score=32.05 TRINITY_DN5329_c0_g2_i1:494-1012(+)
MRVQFVFSGCCALCDRSSCSRLLFFVSSAVVLYKVRGLWRPPSPPFGLSCCSSACVGLICVLDRVAHKTGSVMQDKRRLEDYLRTARQMVLEERDRYAVLEGRVQELQTELDEARAQRLRAVSWSPGTSPDGSASSSPMRAGQFLKRSDGRIKQPAHPIPLGSDPLSAEGEV